MPTKKFAIAEQGVSGVALIQLVSGDWENGSITMTVFADGLPDPVRVVDVTGGREGLNELHEHIAGVRPDNLEHLEILELARVVAVELMFQAIGPKKS
jgi:hypothetical protein